MTTIALGAVELTRVLYLDALIDPEATGLTPDEVRAVAWAEPEWAADGQVRAASCAWVVSSGGRRAVVDPSGNIDEILHDPASTQAHLDAYAAAFAAAGAPIESIDVVILSHLESVGLMACRDGAAGWRAFFPNATVLVPEGAAETLGLLPEDSPMHAAFAALVADGRVATYADGDEVLPGLVAEHTGWHNPAHSVLHVAGGLATFVGHLAVTPVHLGSGPCAPQHADPDAVWRWLQDVRADGRILIGPLWPSPGAARWDGTRLAPVAPA